MLSTYLANKLLDHAIGKAAFPMPASVFLAAFTAAPTAAGGGTEASYPGYARVAVPAAAIAAAAGGQGTNAQALTFPAMTSGAPVTITHWATFDAANAGNMLEFGALDAGVLINPGDQLYFPPGDFDRAAA